MSKKTQILTHGLLSGEINGAALQGALENGGFLGAWYSLLQSRDIDELLRSQKSLDGIFGSAIALLSVLEAHGAVFAASDNSTAALAASSSAMQTIVSDVNLLNLWNNTPANKTRLQNLINQSGSCLVRYEITAGPFWTPPDGDLVTASVFMTGGGGLGGIGSSNYAPAGGGGGGGESRAFQLPSGIPASSQSVTIGSSTASTNTVFQSQIALTGDNGLVSTGGSGAGTTTSTFYDTAATTALWQPTAAGRRGGNGGAGAPSPGNGGSSGSAGLTGIGGSGGSSSVNSNGGAAGSGFGSGGGGGGWPNSPGTPGQPGGDAGSTAYGSGGGGGGSGGYSPGGLGGAGRQGIIIVYGVLGAPKP